jgi:hypothetical protein
MDTKRLAEWVEARICLPCKLGYTCDNWEYEQARKISDILKRTAPFKGKDDQGWGRFRLAHTGMTWAEARIVTICQNGAPECSGGFQTRPGSDF